MINLKVHKDKRGFLVELFRGDWCGGQVTLVEVAPGQSRGGHRHMHTNEKWVVVRGEGVVRLEMPEGTRTIVPVCGKLPRVIDMPPGTGHDIVNTGDEPLWLVYWQDVPYDPENSDMTPWAWEHE